MYRKIGVAKKLINRASLFASETNAIRIEIKTSIDNKKARNL